MRPRITEQRVYDLLDFGYQRADRIYERAQRTFEQVNKGGFLAHIGILKETKVIDIIPGETLEKTWYRQLTKSECEYEGVRYPGDISDKTH